MTSCLFADVRGRDGFRPPAHSSAVEESRLGREVLGNRPVLVSPSAALKSVAVSVALPPLKKPAPAPPVRLSLPLEPRRVVAAATVERVVAVVAVEDVAHVAAKLIEGAPARAVVVEARRGGCDGRRGRNESGESWPGHA